MKSKKETLVKFMEWYTKIPTDIVNCDSVEEIVDKYLEENQEKNIVVMGDDNIGGLTTKVLEHIAEQHKSVVIMGVDNINPLEKIHNINGTQYKKRSPLKQCMSSNFLMGYDLVNGTQTGGRAKEYPKVDILEEYKLIQDKKCGLSKSEREWVVREFNRMYEKID